MDSVLDVQCIGAQRFDARRTHIDARCSALRCSALRHSVLGASTPHARHAALRRYTLDASALRRYKFSASMLHARHVSVLTLDASTLDARRFNTRRLALRLDAWRFGSRRSTHLRCLLCRALRRCRASIVARLVRLSCLPVTLTMSAWHVLGQNMPHPRWLFATFVLVFSYALFGGQSPSLGRGDLEAIWRAT
ncbi:UNVERIFIED_CONTAM: hypothetical protein FKN15_059149 [Acipenser sinensis]